MRKITAFYAWQSDTPERFNRYLIRLALEVAARQINEDAALDVELRIDSDTQGVPGQPPITATILQKIDACDIFVPDLTFVACTDGGKHVPNPNVMVEYGYALRAKTHAAMIPVMNTAFGPPENLPFDMGHLRYPIRYYVSPAAKNAERRAARKQLCGKVEEALRLIVGAQTSSTTDSIPFEQAQEFSSSRVGLVQAGGFLPTVLVRGPRLILHVMPVSAFKRDATIDHAAMQKLIYRFRPAQYEKCEERVNVEGWLLWGPTRPLPPPLNPVSWWCSKITNEGITEIVETLAEVAQDDPPPAINGYELESEIVQTVDRIALGYSELGITSPTILQMTLLGVQGVRLERSRPGYAQGFDRPYIPLKQVYLERFAKPIGGQLRPLFDELWRAAGWAGGSPSFQTDEWAGYNDANARLYIRD